MNTGAATAKSHPRFDVWSYVSEEVCIVAMKAIDGVFAVELVSKVVGALVVEGFVSEGENFELSLFKN